MSNEPIEKTADAIMALINSKPRSPMREEIIECLLRSAQMSDLSVLSDSHGRVYYVSGDSGGIPATIHRP